MATLRHGDTALVTARLPERTRGRMSVAADVPAGAPAGVAAPVTLTVEVFRDYIRPAQVEVQWSRREPGSAVDRERAAVQREIYLAIGEWWDGSRDTREAAAARLTRTLDRVRAVNSPPMLYDALIVLGGVHVDLNNRDAAMAAITEALAIARASGDASNEALALVKTALARGQTGEPEQAVELTKQALAMRQRLERRPRRSARGGGGVDHQRRLLDQPRGDRRSAGGAGPGGAGAGEGGRSAAAGRAVQSARRHLRSDRPAARSRRGLRARARCCAARSAIVSAPVRR